MTTMVADNISLRPNTNTDEIVSSLLESLFPDSWNSSRKEKFLGRAINGCRLELILTKPLGNFLRQHLKSLQLRHDFFDGLPPNDLLALKTLQWVASDSLKKLKKVPVGEQRILLGEMLRLVLVTISMVDQHRMVHNKSSAKDFIIYILIALFHEDMGRTSEAGIRSLCDACGNDFAEDVVRLQGHDKIKAVSNIIASCFFVGDNLEVLAKDSATEAQLRSYDLPTDKPLREFVLNSINSTGRRRQQEGHNDVEIPLSTQWESLLGDARPTISNNYTPSQVFNLANFCKNPLLYQALTYSNEYCGELLTTLRPTEPLADVGEMAGAGLLLNKEDFQIIHKLGKGSYSSVYKGIYKGKVPVAIKIATIKARDVKHLVRALEIPARLEDDSVVRTLGYLIINQDEYVDTLTNTAYVKDFHELHVVVIDELGVMDLDHELTHQRSQKKLFPTTAGTAAMRRVVSKRLDMNLPILLHLLTSLKEAHKKKLYHRDIKPMSKLSVCGSFIGWMPFFVHVIIALQYV